MNDISGNDDYIDESSDLVESQSGENYEVNESDESEEISYSTIDYTQHFENLENNQLSTNALLLACILLLGVAMGLKK